MDEFFYHSSIRAYIITFGNVFNNMKVTHGNGNERKVRIKYASKEKFIEKYFDANKDPEVETILPAMSYEMTGMSYDSARKTNTLHKNVKSNTDGTFNSQLNPVPYNFDFTLTCWARYGDELLQMVEQILPFFQPSYNVTIKEMPEMGIDERDIPILLTGVSTTNEYEGDKYTRRRMEWELTFTLKGWLYPPIKNETNIVKKILVDFGIQKDDSLTLFEGIEFLVEPFDSDPAGDFNLIRAFTFYDPFDGNNLELGLNWIPDSESPLPHIINNRVCSRDGNINSAYWAGYKGNDVFIEADLLLAMNASVVLSSTLSVRVNRITMEGYYFHIYSDGSAEIVYREPNTAVTHLLGTFPPASFQDEDMAKLQVSGSDETDIVITAFKNNLEMLQMNVTSMQVSGGSDLGFSTNMNGCLESVRLGTLSSSTFVEAGRGFSDGFGPGFR